MNSLLKKIQAQVKPFSELLEKWRWFILVVISVSLLSVEIQEFLVLRILNQAFHYFELFQYAVLIISTGLLIELLARSNRAHKQTVKILEYKHRLSLEFASTDDWETLIHKLTELPSKITTGVEEAYLLVSNPINGNFESADHWVVPYPLTGMQPWNPMAACAKCTEKNDHSKPTFHLCRQEQDTESHHVYSLGISSQHVPTTVLKFKLKSDVSLSRYEEELFNNIGDEIVVALQASQDRKRLAEMQSAEVAMAERRIVSTYVHDQLGQNLGYLHLKLDQLAANEGSIKSKEVRQDLKHLQEVANKSYEIVRDILKKIQPETIPHLTNLLREHARTVSHRANISLNFKSIGSPKHLPTNAQQIIFFTFREILSNVERHAQASHIDVLVTWQDNFLDITVSDNGSGFEPSLVQKNEHFGLDIMQERIAIIEGKLGINSSTNSGTVVSISIPIESINRQAA